MNKMRKTTFMRLIEFEDMADTNRLKIGECFLYGKSVINQKSTKDVGQEISYYKVVSKSQCGIEYAPVYDIMEEDTNNKGEE
jgi:hypothetical protein